MILEQGKFELEVNHVVKKNIQTGECFGELALLYNAPRSGSLKAITHSYINLILNLFNSFFLVSKLWAIDRKTFR